MRDGILTLIFDKNNLEAIDPRTGIVFFDTESKSAKIVFFLRKG